MYTWHCIEQLELWYQCVSTFVHGIIEHYSGVNSASTNQNFAVISNSFVAKDQKACLYVFWILLRAIFSAGKYKNSMLLEFIISNKSSKIIKYEAKKLKSKQWITIVGMWIKSRNLVSFIKWIL